MCDGLQFVLELNLGRQRVRPGGGLKSGYIFAAQCKPLVRDKKEPNMHGGKYLRLRGPSSCGLLTAANRRPLEWALGRDKAGEAEVSMP